jgi:diguanylate cyclase (GGDEF)-like protein/PAS domain S-box-containing protein
VNKGLRILFVEDSKDDVLLELHAIKQSGYTIDYERVDTEEQLINALTNRTWDVVLSDYSMPSLGGIKALQITRALDGELPFIIVSGTIGEERAVQAIKEGANDYVNKIHLVLLLPALERALEEYRIKRENQSTKLDLEESKERFYHAFHHTGTGAALVNLNHHFIEINSSFCTMLGYSANEILLKNIDSLIDESSKQLFNEVLTAITEHKKAHSQIELRLIHKNTHKLWVILNVSLVSPSSANTPEYLIIQFQDRTEQRYSEEQLLFLTTYDVLTGLLNRNSILKKINELIQNHQSRFTLYHIDLDRFKFANEIYGTHLGDYLLKSIASQLKKNIDSQATIGYLGGNEFMIIDTKSCDNAERITQGKSICSLLLEPILMKNTELSITASIGIAQYPKDGHSITDMLKSVHTAMQESKNKGGDCCTLYDPSIDKKSENRLLIESELRKALGSNELQVHYQPQIDAATGKPSGMEALIRWQKNGVLIHPDEFIPIAEESSLILKIGEEIVTQACTGFLKLKSQLKDHMPKRLSINLSGRQFSNEQFIPMLEKNLRENHFPPEQLEIEITETTLIHNIKEARRRIDQLGAMGIQIAIDDFGTGYSSLGYLKDLPINRLKIDKSFVESCISDFNSQSIIASIISLAHRLGLEVTAEGVENQEQRQFLLRHHCDEFQGFYFSPPLDETAMIAFFSKYN